MRHLPCTFAAHRAFAQSGPRRASAPWALAALLACQVWAAAPAGASPALQDKADQAIKALNQRIEAVKKTAGPGRSCIFLDGDQRRADRAYQAAIAAGEGPEADRHYQEAAKAAQEGLARKAPPNCR